MWDNLPTFLIFYLFVILIYKSKTANLITNLNTYYKEVYCDKI